MKSITAVIDNENAVIEEKIAVIREAAKKKLITTNEDVVNYDFYRPENIYVYKGKIDLGDIFFEEDYKEVDQEIYEKYSLRSWLKEIVE